jgi:hypothetical protein
MQSATTHAGSASGKPSTRELCDLITIRLEEHAAIARTFEAVSEIAARLASERRQEIGDKLWAGLAVMAGRLGDELQELMRDVNTLRPSKLDERVQ